MGSTRKIEILVGLFMVVGLLAFLVLSVKISNLGNFTADKGYPIKAQFDNVGGLRERAQVMMSGVRVGRVTGIEYDPKTYRANVTMQIFPAIDFLPKDTQASIYTAGLLGEQYISLEPGGDEKVMKAGDSIFLTQSAIVLEEIIGKVLVNMTTK